MASNLGFPPIYILPSHLEPSQLHYFEEEVPSLTYDIHEAELVLGKISKRERAEFELRRHKLKIQPGSTSGSGKDSHSTAGPITPARQETVEEHPSPKRRKVGDVQHPDYRIAENNRVQVLKLSWLTDCLASGRLLPVDNYLLYEGFKISSDVESSREQHKTQDVSAGKIRRRDAGDHAVNTTDRPAPSSWPFSVHDPRHSRRPRPALERQTTSEHNNKLPEVPDFLYTTYSCQRPTPMNPPNEKFILELKKIRTLRLLQGNPIGVRAYSTSIAALSAYPHVIQGPHDLERLPGCSTKIAELYQEWLMEGKTAETAAAAADAKMSTLKLFYDIWGVGDTTAREFYNKGWKDLDDLVEYGWSSLTRVQQIGVKFYDEFQQMIPRQEVEEIANLVLENARTIETGFQMAIVGGYRRGKKESGDVDVILSHRDESQTMNMINNLVVSLERANLITHTLSLWTKNSERGQLPLAWQGEGARRGSGFDTLDKAMVVWQDRQKLGNDAPHRRVDIIISPWKTVGCALLGWSGGTTFQRDLRRYCKQEMGLKFDSSGIRRRSDGTWVNFESRYSSPDEDPNNDKRRLQLAPDMDTAEKRVFEGLNLAWRDPTERCTG